MGCGPSSAALYAAKEEATALRADLRGARGAEAEARGREGLARDAERRALRAAADQVRCASLLPAESGHTIVNEAKRCLCQTANLSQSKVLCLNYCYATSRAMCP